jgi:predicted N-acetyltransferase YhbS
MTIAIRRAIPSDASDCGRIIYSAFRTLSEYHRFPPDFPSEEAATGIATMLLNQPAFFAVVAEADGRTIGCCFMELHPQVAGIGPVAVDPDVQNQGVGRTLMQAVMDHAKEQKIPCMRLLQTAYHNRSLCLYTKLGFQTRAPVSVIQGPPLKLSFPGYHVRPITHEDIAACSELCTKVHGFGRSGEIHFGMAQGTAMLVEHLGRITAYTTGIGFFGHSVAESNQDLKALIAAAPEFFGAGFLLPTQNYELFNWCLENGLQLVMQMTLMTTGLYSEPSGAWLPSVLY